jgi:hypothetical protein
MSVYIPPQDSTPPIEPKLYVKFSNNIYLHESYLKQQNIEYDPDELIDTPLGKAIEIKEKDRISE